MSTLLERLKATSTIKQADILSKSKFFGTKEPVATRAYGVNVAFSGDLHEGFTSGLTVWAAPSKHFKSNFLLMCIRAYLDKYKDAVCVFYDSEFGSPQSYFEAFGIDPARILHVPITNIEQLKFDVMAQLQGFQKGDRVFIAVDSVGNLASIKETEDALNEKAVADMTRAKSLKSLFRMVTPFLTIKDLPMHVVNHTYQTQETYSKTVVSGGTGIYYSADTIFTIGREQDKDDKTKEIDGFWFNVIVEKSRFVKEKSKIQIYVSYADGIDRYSGLMDMALESGHVIKPKAGWYQRVNKETGEIEEKNWRLGDTGTAEFWDGMLADKSFQTWVNAKFRLSQIDMLGNDEIDAEMAAVKED